MPKEHIEFLENGRLWLEVGNQLFVHAGFNPNIPLDGQATHILAWDRMLIDVAWNLHILDKDCKISKYEEIFIGHTPTQNYNIEGPIHACNIWLLDTGAGWSGRLTIMDIKTKEFWQSDPIVDLYGGMRGR